MRVDRDRVQVLVVDFQERLFAAMPEGVRDGVLRNVENLLFVCRELEVPIVVTEQYPKGLGATVPSLRDPRETPFEKTAFSAMREPGFAPRVVRPQVLVVGMETHVCVALTVQDLRIHAFEVGVVGDGCLSRREEDRACGLELCRQAGAAVLPVETALFALLERAGSPLFKEVSRRIR
jgi:nicotinamidase-related amidase